MTNPFSGPEVIAVDIWLYLYHAAMFISYNTSDHMAMTKWSAIYSFHAVIILNELQTVYNQESDRKQSQVRIPDIDPHPEATTWYDRIILMIESAVNSFYPNKMKSLTILGTLDSR